MKKFTATIFCLLATCLNSFGWIGGPFSNNTFTASGDDGVYEAIASLPNGTGLFRWGISNSDGNIAFGVGGNENIWFFEGEVYQGTCFGTVNSVVDEITVIGNAASGTFVANSSFSGEMGLRQAGVGGVIVAASGRNPATREFFGEGTLFVTGSNATGAGTDSAPAITATGAPQIFIVFGSRVALSGQ